MADLKDVQDVDIQQQLDFINDIQLNAPTNKLDADQYMAEDLDGVTESVFGAGNMGYASLQAAQTDLMLGTSGFFEETSGAQNNDVGGITFSAPGNGAESFDLGAKETDNGDLTSETDRPFEEVSENFGSDLVGTGLTAVTAGSISASELSSNAGNFSTSSGFDGGDGVNGIDGGSGQGGDGSDGANGNDGNGGNCNDGCGDITINNNFDIDVLDVTNLLNATFTNLGDTISTLTLSITRLSESLTDILESLDISSLVDLSIVTNLLTELTEQISDILELTLVDITDLTGDVTNLLEQVLDITNTNILSPLSETTFNALNNVVTDLDSLELIGDKLEILGDVTTTVENILTQITDSIQNIDLDESVTEVLTQLGDLEGLTISIVETIETALGDTVGGLLGDGSGEGDVNILADIGALGLEVPEIPLDVVVNPVEDLVGDIDLDLDLATDLLNPNGGAETDNAAGDTDLVINPDLDLLDTDLLDGGIEVELDAIEALLGDIDLDLGVGTNILGDLADDVVNDGLGGSEEDNLLSEVGDAVGDLAEGILPGLGGDETAESDLDIDTNIDIIDQNLADTDLDSLLDPVEEVVGDIDVSLDLTTDLFGDNETDNAAGDTDIDLGIDLGGAIDLLNSENDTESGTDSGEGLVSWTENTISDGSGLFDDLTSGLGGEGDALPDPVGTVAEGLGALDIGSDLDSGSLGGLFG